LKGEGGRRRARPRGGKCNWRSSCRSERGHGGGDEGGRGRHERCLVELVLGAHEGTTVRDGRCHQERGHWWETRPTTMGEEAELVSPGGWQLHLQRVHCMFRKYHPDIDLILNLFWLNFLIWAPIFIVEFCFVIFIYTHYGTCISIKIVDRNSKITWDI
jgi:hypothetical protein